MASSSGESRSSSVELDGVKGLVGRPVVDSEGRTAGGGVHAESRAIWCWTAAVGLRFPTEAQKFPRTVNEHSVSERGRSSLGGD